jgi:RNA polymerase sigma-70 factor (ECF subfamily)
MSSATVLSSGHCIARDDSYVAHHQDLALAAACARGEPAALAAFEARYLPELRGVWARARGSTPPVDELVQTLRAKLFVGERPRIADYRGASSLKTWLRVVATRTLIELARRHKTADPIDESGEHPIASRDDDPETAYLKRRYSDEIRRAFEQAARGLDAESRGVLHQHYARGLGIDAIAGTRGVHRATAARRLAGAREAVLRETRQLLMGRLRVSRAELESILRLVDSEMHVSVERVFGE